MNQKQTFPHYAVRAAIKVCAALTVFLFSPTAVAQNNSNADSNEQDVIRLSDTVTGNLEQPNVLFVVPWQSELDKRIIDQPLKSELNSVFSLIDESEHKREIRFLESLSEKNTSGAQE